MASGLEGLLVDLGTEESPGFPIASCCLLQGQVLTASSLARVNPPLRRSFHLRTPRTCTCHERLCINLQSTELLPGSNMETTEFDQTFSREHHMCSLLYPTPTHLLRSPKNSTRKPQPLQGLHTPLYSRQGSRAKLSKVPNAAAGCAGPHRAFPLAQIN